MLDDIPPAMRMMTAWVRNDYEWSSDSDHEQDYIHYRTNDLAGWLEGIVPAG